MRFDLPAGHDQAATVQQILCGFEAALDNLCLCHARCNAECADRTAEVEQRLRLKEQTEAPSREVRKRTRKRAA